MILRHEKFDHEIKLEGISNLVIENIELFRIVVEDINKERLKEVNGFKLYNDNYEEIDINKNIILINNLILLDLNERVILNSLYKEVKEEIMVNYYKEFDKLEKDINEFIKNAIFNNNYNLTYDCSLNIEDLLKISSLKFNQEDNIVDKFLSYLDLVKDYLKIKTIILINSRNYFTDEEYKNLFEEVKRKDISLLFIENYNNRVSFPDEKLYIIDSNLCEL